MTNVNFEPDVELLLGVLIDAFGAGGGTGGRSRIHRPRTAEGKLV